MRWLLRLRCLAGLAESSSDQMPLERSYPTEYTIDYQLAESSSDQMPLEPRGQHRLRHQRAILACRILVGSNAPGTTRSYPDLEEEYACRILVGSNAPGTANYQIIRTSLNGALQNPRRITC